jgi:hypothetical protein
MMKAKEFIQTIAMMKNVRAFYQPEEFLKIMMKNESKS